MVQTGYICSRTKPCGEPVVRFKPTLSRLVIAPRIRDHNHKSMISFPNPRNTSKFENFQSVIGRPSKYERSLGRHIYIYICRPKDRSYLEGRPITDWKFSNLLVLRGFGNDIMLL